ncbi:PadR family transcriptional regulator [Paenibacillus baekrokdamisoli]|uniref:PadR family transcriptional regulator n=1 Tax=Paenibacillus baekrokdamisoli TaxID=1712516 RepID=A0A3G9J5G3_9BACL|nr:PadR family transcriptional regulator [Paenibacillus baekrokdamisoli]MBB3072664.1 DNA-binding PadR family transcriptional regulator [Paenibacillus baekrokdamisoli]BBH18948.1 PadR family transcriptional regulator [Paenibacillus baekrokdamisoli]
MAKRKITNMLALAVLSMLNERPMHPYEISALMKQRGIADVIKLNNGSLYSTVDSLLNKKWIESVETQREGKHPERTIYVPTELGRAEFQEWLRTIIDTPIEEYPQFTSGLSFIAHIAPQEAILLLLKRVKLIKNEVTTRRAMIQGVIKEGVGRIFLVEQDYKLTLFEAELNWLNQFIDDIQEGRLTVQQEGQQAWKVSGDFNEQVEGKKENG